MREHTFIFCYKYIYSLDITTGGLKHIPFIGILELPPKNYLWVQEIPNVYFPNFLWKSNIIFKWTTEIWINLTRKKENTKIAALPPAEFPVKCNYIFLVPKYTKYIYSCFHVTSKVQSILTTIWPFHMVVDWNYFFFWKLYSGPSHS